MGDVPATAAAPTDKRAHAEEVLSEVLKLMGVTARLEVKDVAATEARADKQAQPASISVAIFPEGDAPGLAPGKRSPVADALQFLANKIVNRGQDKKWINLAIGGHPEPRQQKPPQERAPQQQAPAQPQQQRPPQQAQGPQQPQQHAQKKERPPRENRPPRSSEEGGGSQQNAPAQVADDPALQKLGRQLAEKAVQFGRFFAVLPMTHEERTNLIRGAQGVAEMQVRQEGEGRHRRVSFHPAAPKPMPRKSAMPDYDDEEDVDEE